MPGSAKSKSWIDFGCAATSSRWNGNAGSSRTIGCAVAQRSGPAYLFARVDGPLMVADFQLLYRKS